jgi:hypothetical protein
MLPYIVLGLSVVSIVAFILVVVLARRAAGPRHRAARYQGVRITLDQVQDSILRLTQLLAVLGVLGVLVGVAQIGLTIYALMR